MSTIPVHRLKNAEIIYLSTHRCRHSHTFLEHYQCYQSEFYAPEKIGFLDIEASGLQADFGIMLSYCIKSHNTDKILFGLIKKHDIMSGAMDKHLVKQCIKDMMKFDRLVGFYSGKFDIPFIRTRALANKLEFPTFKALKHTDVYMMAKFKLKLHSNRQESVCRAILGETEKNHIDSKYWLAGLRGDGKSLRYILDHNKRDVRDLEKIYNKLSPYVRITDSSI